MIKKISRRSSNTKAVPEQKRTNRDGDAQVHIPSRQRTVAVTLGTVTIVSCIIAGARRTANPQILFQLIGPLPPTQEQHRDRVCGFTAFEDVAVLQDDIVPTLSRFSYPCLCRGQLCSKRFSFMFVQL